MQPDDPAKLAAAKAKADDIEAKLHAGGDFSQLARTFSDGPTAAEGGDLGQFHRGALAKVLEDKTFALKAGQYTEPIRTRQGFVILKVVEHIPGGVPAYKDVEEQVEENFFMARMEPAMRAYLTTMREQAYHRHQAGLYRHAAPAPSRPSRSTAPMCRPRRRRRRRWSAPASARAHTTTGRSRRRQPRPRRPPSQSARRQSRERRRGRARKLSRPR